MGKCIHQKSSSETDNDSNDVSETDNENDRVNNTETTRGRSTGLERPPSLAGSCADEVDAEDGKWEKVSRRTKSSLLLQEGVISPHLLDLGDPSGFKLKGLNEGAILEL
ncbi:hypothetical protein M5689_000008 [Euphorbia peplus]|nr:hypothetical protein M5689_000008 [Euphorbia peplus]